MSSGKKDQEPSMEDILSSIRRIIADDDEGDQRPRREPPSALWQETPARPVPASDGGSDLDDSDDDVLDLTQVVEPGGPSRPAPPRIEEPFDDEIGLEESADGSENTAELGATPKYPPLPMNPTPVRASLERSIMNDDMLVSKAAASASTSALAKLAKAASGGEPAPLNGGDKTVETFLVELLRPMLKDWLDANLEGVVERVVEQEVKKLARRAELM